MKQEFTGRHMAMILVGGFGIVIAVNLLLATLAVRGFGGVVVDNSYVASQKFNGWLAAARRGKDLGWEAQVARDGTGYIALRTQGVPSGSHVTADIRRPLGQPERATLSFLEISPGSFVSKEAVAPGRWIVRMTVISGRDRWVMEEQIR